MHAALREEVGQLAQGLARFTQDLIRIPSPGLHEKDVAGRIDEELRALRFDLVFTDDVGNVIGILLGDESGEALVVTTHMDTARPDRIDEWWRPPFSGEISMGRIHGVGAASCKGSLASLIYAAHAVARFGRRTGVTVIAAATTAGTKGFGVGVRHLLRTTLPETRFRPVFVLAGEPTKLTFMRGAEGRIELDVTVAGSVEEAVQQGRRRARELLCPVCCEGSASNPSNATLTEPEEIVRSEHRFVSTLRLHRRMTQRDSEDEVVGRLEDDLADAAAFDPRVEVLVRPHEEIHRLYTGHTRRARSVALPWSTDESHPLVARARDALVRAGCRWSVWGGARQSPWFSVSGSVAAGEFGLPVLGYGPGEPSRASSCNESISLLALESATFGSAVLIQSLCSVRRDDGVLGKERSANEIAHLRGAKRRGARDWAP
jgi:acetylornithine deacetylase/succinyl-diaminopimelate desuccinylase-like protein